MKIGDILALCFAGIAVCTLLPWAAALSYKRRRTVGLPRVKKEVAKDANSYRRYSRYTILIVAWAVIISIYIAILDHAANDSGFLGAKGSASRNLRLEILAFVRTGFAVVHLPLVTAVLASTIPYWTMAKIDRPTVEPIPLPDAGELKFTPDRPMRVSQIFYLADRTWSGLIGWAQTAIYGAKEGGFSITWAQLAVVAGLAYVGFPLLSLAYVTTSTQYWEDHLMPATVSLGGMTSNYSDQVGFIDGNSTIFWVWGSYLPRTGLADHLLGFNSSDSSPTPFRGMGDQDADFPWANNKTMITYSPNTTDNIQLPIAGIRAFAQCNGISSYNANADLSTAANLGLQSSMIHHDNGSWSLGCNDNCYTPGSDPFACQARSSLLNVTQFRFENQSGYLVDAKAYTTHFRFDNVEPSYQAQAQSCVRRYNTNQLSVADMTFAISDQNNNTFRAVECSVSIGYIRPTVNTLIGSYIDATSSSSPVSILEANTSQLLNLTLSPYLTFFHQGPPEITLGPGENSTIAPITDGFNWISGWAYSNVTSHFRSSSTIFPPNLTGSDLLSHDNYSRYVSAISTFDERLFLGPLAQYINDPLFFRNDTVTGVIFKTDQGVAYGRTVSAVAAVLVLALPVLWTLALSVAASTERRWTPTLDAFALFKLGGDWGGVVRRDMRMVSLSRAGKTMREIPGNIVVNPASGVVELANPPEKVSLPPRGMRGGKRGGQGGGQGGGGIVES